MQSAAADATSRAARPKSAQPADADATSRAARPNGTKPAGTRSSGSVVQPAEPAETSRAGRPHAAQPAGGDTSPNAHAQACEPAARPEEGTHGEGAPPTETDAPPGPRSLRREATPEEPTATGLAATPESPRSAGREHAGTSRGIPEGSETPDAPARAAARAPQATRWDAAELWEAVVSRLMDRKPALGAVLQHGSPVEVTPARILLAFPPGSFFGRQAEALDGRQAIAEAAEQVTGARPAVEVTQTPRGGGDAKTLAQLEVERRDAKLEATREKALSHPLVEEAARVFSVPRDNMTVRVELD